MRVLEARAKVGQVPEVRVLALEVCHCLLEVWVLVPEVRALETEVAGMGGSAAGAVEARRLRLASPS